MTNWMMVSHMIDGEAIWACPSLLWLVKTFTHR